MGNDLFKGFGVDIAAEIKSALDPGIPSITLVSRTVGTPSATDLTAGATITETSYTCQGFLDFFDAKRFGGTTIEQGSRVVVIIGDTLPSGVLPKPEDRIIAEGDTLHVVGPIVRDPAAATYTCEVRS